MTDPSKSQPGWTFPSTSTAGSTSNIFGQTSTNTSKAPASNVFGATSSAPGTSAPSLFGGGSTANQGSSLFGGANAGGASSNNQSSNFFGAGSAGGNTLGITSPAGGAGFNFGPNQSGQPPASPVTGPSSNTGGSNLFGNVGSSTSTSAPFGATTPTSKAPGNFSLYGNPSTTPAGPPPSNPLPFGAQNSQEQQGNIFSQGQPKSTAQNNAFTAAPSSLFSGASQPSGGIFQNSQPANTSTKTSTSQPTMSVLSGAVSNNVSSNVFTNKPTAQPSAGLFNNLTNSSATNSSTIPAPSDMQQPKAEAPKSIFGSLGGQSAASSSKAQSGGLSMFPSTTQPSDAPKPSLSFFPPSTSTPSDSGSTATSGPSLFAGLNTGSGISAPPASVSTTTMFADLGKPTGKSKEASASTAAPSAPSLAAAAPLSGLGDAKPTTFTMQPPATKTTDPVSSISGNANLGASTSGPAPTPQSRLKNKSMDEIITRWASDLSKYQKEFQRQAEKVAEWDRMLVENSDKIQKLYGNTLEAQRATAEVERQITVVENEQDELETYLESYEAQIEEMWNAQGGGSDALRGPDKERQET